MAQVCEICGKGPQFGSKISHAHNVSRRRWNVNLRPVHAVTKHGNKRLRVCAPAASSQAKWLKPASFTPGIFPRDIFPRDQNFKGPPSVWGPFSIPFSVRASGRGFPGLNTKTSVPRRRRNKHN